MCRSDSLAPSVKMRLAHEEDFDDLMPVFERQSDAFAQNENDFVLADLIEHQSDTEKCLAMEVDGKAVGFMSVSCNVEAFALANDFQLRGFSELCGDNGKPSAIRIAIFCVDEQVRRTLAYVAAHPVPV